MGILDRLLPKKEKRTGADTHYIDVSESGTAEMINKKLDCPRCGRRIADKTPRHGVALCPCGTLLKVRDFEIE